METVKFKKGLVYRIERFFFTHCERAKDTCTLKWRLIKIVLSIPFTFMTWVYLRLGDKHNAIIEDMGKQATAIKAITLFLTVVLALAIMRTGEGEAETFQYSEQIVHLVLVGVFLFSTVIVGVWVGTIAFIIMGFIELFKRIPKPKIQKSHHITKKQDSIFKTLYRSAKDKLCNKIEWIDK